MTGYVWVRTAAIAAVLALGGCKPGENTWLWLKSGGYPQIQKANEFAPARVRMRFGSFTKSDGKCDNKTVSYEASFTQEGVTHSRKGEDFYGDICVNEVNEVDVRLDSQDGKVRCDPAAGCSGTASASFPNNNGTSPKQTVTFETKNGELVITDAVISSPKT